MNPATGEYVINKGGNQYVFTAGGLWQQIKQNGPAVTGINGNSVQLIYIPGNGFSHAISDMEFEDSWMGRNPYGGGLGLGQIRPAANPGQWIVAKVVSLSAFPNVRIGKGNVNDVAYNAVSFDNGATWQRFENADFSSSDQNKPTMLINFGNYASSGGGKICSLSSR